MKKLTNLFIERVQLHRYGIVFITGDGKISYRIYSSFWSVEKGMFIRIRIKEIDNLLGSTVLKVGSQLQRHWYYNGPEHIIETDKGKCFMDCHAILENNMEEVDLRDVAEDIN